jgi:threonine/homoserine/homoserine lactone efflux protein
MVEPSTILISAALGWLAGFVTSIPGGPVNATLMAEGGRRGMRWCAFLSVGAVVMEAVYCTMAFAGFAQVFEVRWVRATMELVSFLLMLWLGVKYLRGAPIPGEVQVEHFVEETFHPHTAFWTGFLRVLGNPGILLLWITVAATLLSRDWLENTWDSKWPFVGGVAAGGLAWFGVVSWGVARGRGQLSPRTLRRLAQASGIFLLLVAVVVGSRLVALLAQGRHPH